MDNHCIPVHNFTKEFDDSIGPSRAIMRQCWNKVVPRAHRQGGTLLPLSQGLVLSVLYMLHIFYALHESPPSAFDSRRHAYLSRFADWTPCCCTLNCGRSWNFISHTGIWRQRPGTYAGCCHVDMHLNHNFRHAKHVAAQKVVYAAAYRATWRSWWNAYTRLQTGIVS